MKFLIITKKHLMLGICLTLAVAVAIIGSASAYANSNRLLPIYCVETDKKQVAISFDAAWGTLKRYKISQRRIITVFMHHLFSIKIPILMEYYNNEVLK